MGKPEDRVEKKLPVTAELGDEGGSFGDATTQAETFKGAQGNPRVDPKRVAAVGREAEGTVPDQAPDDEVKDASEPPSST